MNYVVFDLEATCGWTGEHRQSEIIEIGAVKYNENLEKIGEFQSFIRPVVNPELTEFCTKLTSITQADVDNADTFNKVVLDFREWCMIRDGKPIGNGRYFRSLSPHWLCSWGNYDKKQLRADCIHWDIDTKWIQNHISIKHQHGRMIGVKNGIGMKTALDMLNIPLEGTHHRGIDDARNIGKIFVEIFPQLKFE